MATVENVTVRFEPEQLGSADRDLEVHVDYALSFTQPEIDRGERFELSIAIWPYDGPADDPKSQEPVNWFSWRFRQPLMRFTWPAPVRFPFIPNQKREFTIVRAVAGPVEASEFRSVLPGSFDEDPGFEITEVPGYFPPLELPRPDDDEIVATVTLRATTAPSRTSSHVVVPRWEPIF